MSLEESFKQLRDENSEHSIRVIELEKENKELQSKLDEAIELIQVFLEVSCSVNRRSEENRLNAKAFLAKIKESEK